MTWTGPLNSFAGFLTGIGGYNLFKSYRPSSDPDSEDDQDQTTSDEDAGNVSDQDQDQDEDKDKDNNKYNAENTEIELAQKNHSKKGATPNPDLLELNPIATTESNKESRNIDNLARKNHSKKGASNMIGLNSEDPKDTKEKDEERQRHSTLIEKTKTKIIKYINYIKTLNNLPDQEKIQNITQTTDTEKDLALNAKKSKAQEIASKTRQEIQALQNITPITLSLVTVNPVISSAEAIKNEIEEAQEKLGKAKDFLDRTNDQVEQTSHKKNKAATELKRAIEILKQRETALHQATQDHNQAVVEVDTATNEFEIIQDTLNKLIDDAEPKTNEVAHKAASDASQEAEEAQMATINVAAKIKDATIKLRKSKQGAEVAEADLAYLLGEYEKLAANAALAQTVANDAKNSVKDALNIIKPILYRQSILQPKPSASSQAFSSSQVSSSSQNSSQDPSQDSSKDLLYPTRVLRSTKNRG